MPHHAPEWEDHMGKIETRIENLERMEREMWGRVNDIESREEDIEVKLGMKSRVSRVYKPKLIKKQTNDAKMRIERVRRLGSEKLKERRARMQRQIKDVVKKADDVKEGPVSVEEKSPEEERKIQEERKNILKKQVSGVIEKHRGAKKEEKEIPKEIKQLKILTGEEASDARLLFAFLLKRGSVSLEDAMNELGSDKEAIESWANDLKASGLIDVNVFAGKTMMKLRDISAATGEK